MKTVVRRKVIVIPYVHSGEFLVVKDRKFKEWTFITGGCKSYETDSQAARRELIEETRGTLDVPFTADQQSFRFRTTYRESKELAQDRLRGERIVTQYSVFFVDISPEATSMDLKAKFRGTKNVRGAFNENADLSFETPESFAQKTHVWRFIRNHVLTAPFFRDFSAQNGFKGVPRMT
jgi:8-oxo-dGTP pyrophosphatase MutT (NUDIX family)